MSIEENPLPGHLKDPYKDDGKHKLPHRRRRKKRGWFSRLRSRLSISVRKQEARREKRQERKTIKKALKLRKKESRNRKKAARIKKERAGFASIRKSISRPQQNLIGLFTNSLIIFMLTYLISYLLYQFTVILFASYYNIDGTLYFYDLAFNDVSTLWKRFNIILITGSGPVVCLLLGIIFYRRIASSPKVNGYQKLFFIWLSLHLMNHFLGAFAAGVITSDGFGYVAGWLYMGLGVKLFLALIFLLCMMLIGYSSATKFLQSAHYRIKINKENIQQILLYTVLFPLIFGSLILLLFRIPMNFSFPYETIIIFTFILVMIPAIFNRKSIKGGVVNSRPGLWKVRYEHLFMLLLLLVFYRTVLFEGLRIVMRYSFSFSAGLA